MDGAVLRDPRRPRVARDRRPDRGRPPLHQLGHSCLRAEARQLRADLVTERIQAPPPPTGPVPAAAPLGALPSRQSDPSARPGGPEPAAGRDRAPRARRRAEAAAAPAATRLRRATGTGPTVAARPVTRTDAGRD